MTTELHQKYIEAKSAYEAHLLQLRQSYDMRREAFSALVAVSSKELPEYVFIIVRLVWAYWMWGITLNPTWLFGMGFNLAMWIIIALKPAWDKWSKT